MPLKGTQAVRAFGQAKQRGENTSELGENRGNPNSSRAKRKFGNIGFEGDGNADLIQKKLKKNDDFIKINGVLYQNIDGEWVQFNGDITINNETIKVINIESKSNSFVFYNTKSDIVYEFLDSKWTIFHYKNACTWEFEDGKRSGRIIGYTWNLD